ncbi:glycosyl transferase family 1, partial [Pyxidicoccus sp. 3LG]
TARSAHPRAAPRGAEASLELGPEPVDGVPVWHFTPDQPPGRGSETLPGSSSLETAVRVSSAPVVLLGVETASAQAVLPHVKERAWGVHESSLSGTLIESARQQLDRRLVVLEPSRLEEAVRALSSALPSHAGVTRAS